MWLLMRSQAPMRVGSRPALVPMLLWMVGGMGLSGCKDLTGSQPLPAGTVNPSFYSTPAGAIGLRAQALATLEQELPYYLINSGLLTDELESNSTGVSPGQALAGGLSGPRAVDARLLPETRYRETSHATDGDYANLQIVRGNLHQARAAIATYDTGAKKIGDPKMLRAELVALEGYTEILLADLFCSGVPLSTLDFQGDYTYHASSTTAQVYQDAIAQEDSALALADTSTQVQYLARVLKGRALLALNDPTAAGQVVAPVPDGFQYRLAVDFRDTVSDGSQVGNSNKLNDGATVADTEGRHGLPYLSSGDPRMAVTVAYPAGTVDVGAGSGTLVLNVLPLTVPTKYGYGGFAPFVVADGTEARLIQAEAALRAGDATWLTTLNTLRTEWTTGAGGAENLAPLVDPGEGLSGSAADSARVALLFHERAYWLFLTGHRQGDLRRLLRQYNQWFRSEDQVYPTGAYLGVGTRTYGSAVTAPIPGAEDINPLYHGCLDRKP